MSDKLKAIHEGGLELCVGLRDDSPEKIAVEELSLRTELTGVVEAALDKPGMPPLDEFGDYRRVVRGVVDGLMEWKGLSQK